MPENVYIGNFGKGLTLNPLPFNIDNDAFPTLYNCYSWRKRIKRKRGTLFLGQLTRQVQMAAMPNNWQENQLTLVAHAANLLGTVISNITQATNAVVTINGSIFSVGQSVIISGVAGMTQINGLTGKVLAISATSMTLSINSSAFSSYSSGGVAILAGCTAVTPGTLNLVVSGDQTYTDLNEDGTLQGSSSGTGTINYATGAFTVSGSASGHVTGTFSYYPGLPVLGLEDYVVVGGTTQYPLLLSFDQNYAYQVNQTQTTVSFYSVSYYKSSENPVIWSGQDYQQFWTTNYQSAFWATNNNPGMQFESISTISVGNPTTITTSANHGLVTGDWVFFNEITGTDAGYLNGQAFSITVTNGTTFTVAVNTTGKSINNNGIFQTLTATSPTSTGDGIRFYDGDMTGGTGLPVSSSTGWVNFAPPLTASTTSIDTETSALYYLVGASVIIPFKDRILFFSPWIQKSSGNPMQLQDTVIWSWNGTPYYNALVPVGETYNVTAYYVDQTGKGGYLSAGIAQAITTVGYNEDVLLVGFTSRQTRLIYTSNDINPFLFYSINAEFGSASTFSGVTLDRGVISFGIYGISLTTQESSQRIDLEIPDTVFQIQALNNGVQRVNAARDFYREWIYFTYPLNDSSWKFPTQTLLYNYRDVTWAILYENFTTQGNYRKQMHYTWATLPFSTWTQWREPWNSGSTSALFPSIVGGTPEGYVLIKGEGTGEGVSGTIQSITNNGSGATRIVSVNHCVESEDPGLDPGDYLLFQGALGTITATITNITQAVQAVITATNTFTAGQYIFISQVAGMTQINGMYVQVVSSTGSSMVVNINTTTYTAYSSGGLATISPLGMQIGQVIATPNANTFDIDIPYVNQGYIGRGQFSRLSQPLMLTKQFPFYWEQGRQARLCTSKFLMDTTANSQVTVNIYLSQDQDTVFNSPTVNVPPNNSLIYSQIMYTCPESYNIGLTPANTNLQMLSSSPPADPYQIWHRFNTSLIGTSFQLGITLSDAQMRNLTYATSEIALHAIHLVAQPGPQLA